MMKKFIKLLPKVIAILLIISVEGSTLLVDYSYAQQSAKPIDPNALKDDPTATLLTDTEKVGVIPFSASNTGVKSVLPAMTLSSDSNSSANVRIPAIVRKLAKKNYRPNEEIAVVIDNGSSDTYKTELISNGTKVAVKTDDVVVGNTKVVTVTQPSSFRPGKYRLRITNNSGGVSEQDFTWGVLAINPDKSIYHAGETANLAIAVLDEKGEMVCDAHVELQITDPAGKKTSLSIENHRMIVNPECISHDFTLKPDYETLYKVGGKGTYSMLLKAQTKNGSYSINDSFEVRDSIPFDVKRVTATRIFPPHTYPVTMEITANQDFEGTVTETVPANFKISKPGSNASTDTSGPTEIQSASNSAEPSPAPTLSEPAVAGLKTGPIPFDADTLPYDTINNLAESNDSPSIPGGLLPSLAMPFNGPYPVSQEFGESLVKVHDTDLYASFGMHGHDGIDFAMPIGTPVLAVDGGKVVRSGPGDYGTTIVIQHTWGRSYYGHLSAVNVIVGTEVLRGSTIGLSGNTGITTGPHLHFGLKPQQNDKDNGYYGKVDPSYYLGLKQSANAVLGASTTSTNASPSIPEPVSTKIQILTWKINVKKGDKIKIGYNYLAPRISPQFYTLGPATFHDTAGTPVFKEIRKWQIAADAVDLKFKKGSFAKAICAATCTQSITDVGFQPKAVIFTWTLQTAEGYAADQLFGMGFSTSSTEERSMSYWSTDAAATSATGKLRSATKSIVMQSNNGTVLAQADFSSFDSNGFTLSWTTNNASAYIIHYIAIGGADVTNAKAGSFTLASSGASQAFTDPGFKPDFLMMLGNGGGVGDTNSGTASLSAGFASSSTKEGAISVLARTGQAAAADTYRQQRTDASILLLNESGAQDAIADVASFDATGFTLNVTDLPLQNTPIYYLALKGGQYDVGSFDQRLTTGTTAVTTGFQPKGIMLASWNSGSSTAISSSSSASFGGASSSSSEGTIWSDDRDAEATENANMATLTTKLIRLADSPAGGGAATTKAEADLQSFDANGFTVNWTTVEASTARRILYWAAGSGTATQEDYRWYKNADSITPTIALEDENQPVVVSVSKPYVRLRTNIAAGTNAIAASSQTYKLQYSTDQSNWTDFADGWCNDTTGVTCTTSWTARKKITINNSASATDLIDYPLLVKLDSVDIDRAKTQSAGQDLRFVDPSDPTIALNHEVEEYDESGNDFVWVKVPKIDAGSTTDYIWMYYGNAGASAPATELGTSAHATGVWDTNYKLVQHLEESTACGVTFTDSTSNTQNGSCLGSGPAANATGKIGRARTWDGSDDGVSIADNALFEPGAGDQTIDMWVNLNSVTTDYSFLSHYDFSSFGWHFLLSKGGGTCVAGDICYWNGLADAGPVSGIPTTTWTHVAVVKSGSTATFYVNGASVGSLAVNSSPTGDAVNPILIGQNNGGTGVVSGSIDEVRYASTNRSADWVEADYLSGNDSMNSFGTEESQTSSSGAWSFYNNASVTDRTTITTKVLSGSTSSNQETYVENNLLTIPTAIAAGERREWDISLDGTNADPKTTYYFRIVTSEGTPLTSYTRYPTITVGPPLDLLMRHGKWFQYGSVQPFTF